MRLFWHNPFKIQRIHPFVHIFLADQVGVFDLQCLTYLMRHLEILRENQRITFVIISGVRAGEPECARFVRASSTPLAHDDQCACVVGNFGIHRI